MENQDLDLIGQTVGSMPYKIGIVDKDGNVTTQFVAKSSTNRIDIPQSSLGAGGVPQLPSTVNLFSGSAVGNILLSGPSANYDNIGDGLLITLSNLTLKGLAGSKSITNYGNDDVRVDLSSLGLKPIKIPKEKLITNSSFDISDQLSQYIGKVVQGQYYIKSSWADYSNSVSSTLISFEGATINVLPNTTLSMNLVVNVQSKDTRIGAVAQAKLPIPVIQVNDYKN